MSQVAITQKLNQFLKEFEDGTREDSIITNQSFESLSTDEKQIWHTIRKELEDIGITVAAFDAWLGFPERTRARSHDFIATKESGGDG